MPTGPNKRDRAICGIVKNAAGKSFLMVAGGRFNGVGISHSTTDVMDLEKHTWAKGGFA